MHVPNSSKKRVSQNHPKYEYNHGSLHTNADAVSRIIIYPELSINIGSSKDSEIPWLLKCKIEEIVAKDCQVMHHCHKLSSIPKNGKKKKQDNLPKCNHQRLKCRYKFPSHVSDKYYKHHEAVYSLVIHMG